MLGNQLPPTNIAEGDVMAMHLKQSFKSIAPKGGNALPLLTSPSAMYGNRSKTKFLMHLKQSFKSIASFLHRLRRCMGNASIASGD